MLKKYNIICAIDLSGPYGSYSIAKSDKILCAESFLIHNRNNAAFFKSFLDSAQNCSIAIEDIDTWVVGTGPGSFTGLRIASAFVSGATYQSDKICLGIPSAFPIVSTLNLKEGEKAGILFYVSKEMIFLYGIINDAKHGFKTIGNPQSLTIKELKKLEEYDILAYMENQYIKTFLGTKNYNIKIIKSFPIKNMFLDFKDNYTDIKKLIYVRPPAVVRTN